MWTSHYSLFSLIALFECTCTEMCTGWEEKVLNPPSNFWFELYCSTNDKAIHVLHKTTASFNLQLNDRISWTRPAHIGWVSFHAAWGLTSWCPSTMTQKFFAHFYNRGGGGRCLSYQLRIIFFISQKWLRVRYKIARFIQKRVNERWGHWNSINPWRTKNKKISTLPRLFIDLLLRGRNRKWEDK